MGGRPKFHGALGLGIAILLLAGPCVAQSSSKHTFKAPTGETVQFLGDSVALKYFPPPSANCSQCYLSFKLGALSELDAVSKHVIQSLQALAQLATAPG